MKLGKVIFVLCLFALLLSILSDPLKKTIEEFQYGGTVLNMQGGKVTIQDNPALERGQVIVLERGQVIVKSEDGSSAVFINPGGIHPESRFVRLLEVLEKKGVQSEKSNNAGYPFWKLIITAFVTVAFLFPSLYIILSRKYGDGEAKWAFGTAGTILGYWVG